MRLIPPPLVLPGFASPLSRLALGTAGFGTTVSESTAFALLDRFVELGGNLVDTAHVYAAWLPGGHGASERTIGRWLATRDARSRLVLSTKGGHPDLATGRSRLDAASLDRDLTESLARLGASHVDLYWWHRDDPTRPLDQSLRWAATAIASNRIRAIGCSNWTLTRFACARVEALRRGWPVPVASQIGWSAAEFDRTRFDIGDGQFMDAEKLAWHQATRVPVFAYEAQARGFFSPRYRPENTPNFTPTMRDTARKYASATNERRRAVFERVGQRERVSPNAAALAWLLQHEFPVIPIIGPTTIEQLEDAWTALRVELTGKEFAECCGFGETR